MPKNNEPKEALDSIIRKSRVHFYKPIQIAEILYHHRIERKLDLTDPESYRNISKRWRDEVSLRLVGRKSTSSQKYQDNVFEANAMPPKLMGRLGEMNVDEHGFVEAYIYKALEKRLNSVYEVEKYVKSSTADTFSLRELVALFQKSPGLRRSVDKIYEIAVYALFATIVRALKAQITIEIGNGDKEILKDFAQFISMVLGIGPKKTKLVLPAALYRVGVTNAADRGLDMWANFGAAIQVKHLTLTPEIAEGISDGITADRIIVVCFDSEKKLIETLLAQVGMGGRIQAIITISDLDEWYELCLGKKYRKELGGTLLADLGREFEAEFPSSEAIKPFLKERKYDKIAVPEGWEAAA
jgi:type II restriction enzyme